MAGINLRKSEIEAVFSTSEVRAQFPPILTPAEVAQLLRISRSTVYSWAAAGRLDGTFRRRGKHVLYWRDRVIDKIFNGPEWAEVQNGKP